MYNTPVYPASVVSDASAMLTKIPFWPVAVQFRRSTAAFCPAVACFGFAHLKFTCSIRTRVVARSRICETIRSGSQWTRDEGRRLALFEWYIGARPIPPSTTIRWHPRLVSPWVELGCLNLNQHKYDNSHSHHRWLTSSRLNLGLMFGENLRCTYCFFLSL
jgi:hypothetical protein